MIEATLAMLRARREEKIAAAGVIAAICSDDPEGAAHRLEAARDAARELAATCGRRDRARRELLQAVAAWADDMIGPVRAIHAADVRERLSGGG